jgi:predicted NACHT family NTPase
MPRNTYGDTVKKRVKRLLEALLAFVNWEFESNFDIEFKWEAKESTSPKVIFKTTLVALEQLITKDKYPGKLKKEQIREALKLLENFLKILKDNRTKTKGSDDWHFTLTLWSKDKENNLKQFDQAWEESRPEKSKALEANFKKSDAFDWRNICLAMLEAEKPLTTNELMRDEDDRFELEEIHVPLALVERKKPDRRGEEILPEQGSRLYEPEYEEKQRFEHEQFLLDILKDGKGKQNGKRIAIIGEPGAGKTTCYAKSPFGCMENTEILPISISLADLPETNSLEEFLLQYLLDKWLPAALPYFSPEMVEVTEALKTELKKLCNQGRVWLLLDGVDEMPVQGEERLWAISNQLKGWVGQARVVLTCRLNVWEANRNVLADNFEIYRTLEFSYGDSTTPDRVEEFIAKWFNKQPNLGQQLRQELDKPGKERIKDLVKNPLRLALLCSTWNWWRDRGGLPDTKAKLYQGFVEKFYDWKGKEFPTNYTQREKLNRALGELAKLAIDQTTSRFRLKHSWVCEVLGKPDEGLFELALQLGWLNKVGLAAESPDETVYAFWHPTFEEYFAALAVDDWDFFLNHVPDNPKQGIYRIFEKQWKEVILLWLGRGRSA